MYIKKAICLLWITTGANLCLAQYKFILDAEFAQPQKKDSFILRINDVYHDDINVLQKVVENTLKAPIVNGKVKFSIPVNKEVAVITDLLPCDALIAEPGDSIHLIIKDDNVRFSGNGHEKFKVAWEAWNMNKTIGRSKQGIAKSQNPVRDYLYYANSLYDLINRKILLLDSYKNNISRFAYVYLTSSFIFKEEKKIQDDFWTILRRKEELKIPDELLLSLYDSTLRRSLFHDLNLHRQDTACTPGDIAGYLTMHSVYQDHRSSAFVHLLNRFNKKFTRDSAIIYSLRAYETAENEYKGHVWDKMAHNQIRALIKYYGFAPEWDNIIDRFLSGPSENVYKESLQAYISAKKNLSERKKAPEFQLENQDGKAVSLHDLKGKYVIADTWFTGCKPCIDMSDVLRQVEKSVADLSGIVFLNISVDADKDKWQQSIRQKKYTSGSGIQLYTGGKGLRHAMLKDYEINTYPSVFVIDPDGFIVPVADPRMDQGKELTAFLQKRLAIRHDGPYVIYEGQQRYAYQVLPDENGEPGIRMQQASYPLMSATERAGFNFPIKLKEKINPEPAEYPMPSKLLALSDIEGNFDALKKLLVGNGVIDSNYNWTFGSGHLVCNGDFFDRGEQVTECLWLIYSLEEQAQANGGYVHFILGNHEIMNLNGNIAYTQPKYLHASALLNKEYTALWGEKSELGRWLRSKNIMEKIGNMLFVHAGIHPFINESSLKTDDINNLIRPVYDAEDIIRTSNDATRMQFFRSRTSPFWYRGYYQKEFMGYDENEGKKSTATQGQIDSTLLKFNVDIIVTGHTVVADTISVHYKSKVINTDTSHAEGKSEALLYENDTFFRVDAKGNKRRIPVITSSLRKS